MLRETQRLAAELEELVAAVHALSPRIAAVRVLNGGGRDSCLSTVAVSVSVSPCPFAPLSRSIALSHTVSCNHTHYVSQTYPAYAVRSLSHSIIHELTHTYRYI